MTISDPRASLAPYSQIQNSTVGTGAENNVVTYLTNEDFGIAAQWRGRTLKALN
jgi:hypothetical protein